MPLNWSQLNKYKCPIPGCDSPLKENKDGSMHVCTSCPFKISEEKISQMVVLRYRKLEPPQFIKEMKEKEKKSRFLNKWIDMFRNW